MTTMSAISKTENGTLGTKKTKTLLESSFTTVSNFTGVTVLTFFSRFFKVKLSVKVDAIFRFGKEKKEQKIHSCNNNKKGIRVRIHFDSSCVHTFRGCWSCLVLISGCTPSSCKNYSYLL